MAELRNAFVIVRPHPSNLAPWREAALGDPGLVVHPTGYSGIPMSDEEIETFRDSLLASNAVIGINTTAMIEAAILDRPVLTVRDSEFVHSQQQTLHFSHLPTQQGGCVLVAETLADHVRQLETVLHEPGAQADARRRFVQDFVRPRGIAQPATLHLCDAIEHVARHARDRARPVSGLLRDAASTRRSAL